jgi:hypothetical protein
MPDLRRSRTRALRRHAILGLVGATLLIALMYIFLDGSEFESAAREAVGSDLVVQQHIGELLEIKKKWFGGEKFESLGDDWSADYKFHVRGTRADGDVSIHLRGRGSEWKYEGQLVTDDGAPFPIQGGR